MLDPGLAFGTGSHPSTRLCLQWLERSVHGGERVLDYGCGSGILAIAALRLGASAALGVDVDPLALPAAQANAQRNRVDARFIDTETAPDFQADLVVANILANPLILLAPLLAGYTSGEYRAHCAVGHTQGAGRGGRESLCALVHHARRRWGRGLGFARGPALSDYPVSFLPYPFSRA